MIIKRLKRFVKIKWTKKSKRRTRIAEKPGNRVSTGPHATPSNKREIIK